MTKIKIGAILIILLSFNLNGQISNGNFESWIDEITPTDWQTNNFPGVWTTVSRSTTAHSGSFAARMDIADYNGAPMFPVLSTTFPINQQYSTLTGYYQFHPTISEAVLMVLSYYFKDGATVASGQLDIESASASYTDINLETNLNNIQPDSVTLQFQIISNSVTDPGIGSFALIDQLSFSQTTSVEQTDQNPVEFSLQQNYPNPFNPITTIQYSVPSASVVQLKIYDILGNEVAELVNEEQANGTYRAEFEATNLSSGTYFYQIRTGSFVETKKMLL